MPLIINLIPYEAGNKKQIRYIGFYQKSHIMKPIIFKVTDGKIGHERQSDGLARALHLLTQFEIQSIPQCSLIEGIKQFFSKNRNTIPKGSIIIGAGHKTHFTLLLYRLKYRLKTIVIMKPSLPFRCFDFCIIPYHDRIPEKNNILCTEGAMNLLPELVGEKTEKLLILIGGKSAHCDWDNLSIYTQIEHLITDVPVDLPIYLTTSRRTPEDFLTHFPDSLKARIQRFPIEEVSADWVINALITSQYVWVTEESISMIYEALSAGCQVSLLKVPNIQGKILFNINRLIEQKLVNEHPSSEKPLKKTPLDEATRIAQRLISKGLINDQ